MRALAAKADVVIQNFKTGGADRLGLGYAALSAENPGLIYRSIAGYGSDGPEATRPGYDLVIQGEAGLMALNGEPTQPPLKFWRRRRRSLHRAICGAGRARRARPARAHRQGPACRARFVRSRHDHRRLLRAGGTGARRGPAALWQCPSLDRALMACSRRPMARSSSPSATMPKFERFCRQVIERPDLLEDERFHTTCSAPCIAPR